MKMLAKAALATAIAAVACPALAQETIGTMQVNGSVSTSTGGDFVRASSGEAIQAGERIMVGEGSSASITFTNGAVVNYTAPGVYTVHLPAAAGVGAGAAAAATLTGGEIALISAAGLIAASGIAASTLDDDEDLLGEPISR